MEEIKERLSKKRIAGFGGAVLALILIVGTFAYYNSTLTINNPLKANAYAGETLIEEFPGDDDWLPGEEVTKKTDVRNTGDVDLVVRISMKEAWTLTGSKGTVTHDSTQPGFLTATATTSVQTDPTDGLTTGDQSVVYKKMTASGWTLATDGYWYYDKVLKKNESTGSLLESITLAGDLDIGKFNVTKYWTKKDTEPGNTAADHGTDLNNQWVEYTGANVPQGATFNKSVKTPDPDAPGYSGADYLLTIQAETLQATKEAVGASWVTVPDSVKTGWNLK